MKPKHDSKQDKTTDNDHQKTVSGQNQRGPADKIGKDAGGAYGSRGQNLAGAPARKKAPLQLDLTSLKVMGLVPKSSSMRATTSNAYW